VLPLPDFVPVDKALAHDIKEVHELLSFALIAVAGLHIVAALKHQFIDRDGLIGRIWPQRAA
jgi:cytochrome b561